jgi:hypothetical protein
MGLRSLHLLIVGVRSVLFSRRDTQGPRCSSVFQVLYEISLIVSWHLKAVKRFKLNAPQLLPVVSWNLTYQPVSAVKREKPRYCSPLPNFSNKYHAIHEVPVFSDLGSSTIVPTLNNSIHEVPVVVFAVALLYLY